MVVNPVMVGKGMEGSMTLTTPILVTDTYHLVDTTDLPAHPVGLDQEVLQEEEEVEMEETLDTDPDHGR